MTRFSLTSIISGAALAVAVVAQASDGKPVVYQGDAAKGMEIATTICVACHGPDGNSAVPAYPKIAGQHAPYLFKQMKNFKMDAAGKADRANPIMGGMIAAFSEDQMKDLAAYFAGQKQSPGQVQNKEVLDLGKKLYRAGDASRGLPACAACHGPSGAGLPAQYPRIAGQFQEYTETQLKAFRNSERTNDPNKMMQMVAVKLTDAEIRALADYLAGLR